MREALRTFQIQRKKNHSFVVNILAQALYALFAASDGNKIPYIVHDLF